MGFFFRNRKARQRTPSESPVAPHNYASCRCFQEYYPWEKQVYEADSDEELERRMEGSPAWSESAFHLDPPFNSLRSWEIAQEIIDAHARKGSKELNLGKIMDRSDFMNLNTLPDNIGTLKDLEKLTLYGSNISSIPRAIAGCKKLQSFEPYTSYRLDWFPYEMKKCQKLAKSCISIRALYGNYKLRAPFPDLTKLRWAWLPGTDYCSICEGKSRPTEQYWLSQRVGTDVIPLLVSVCSEDCLEKAGSGEEGYVSKPHKGGLSLVQPSRE